MLNAGENEIKCCEQTGYGSMTELMNRIFELYETRNNLEKIVCIEDNLELNALALKES